MPDERQLTESIRGIIVKLTSITLPIGAALVFKLQTAVIDTARNLFRRAVLRRWDSAQWNKRTFPIGSLIFSWFDCQ